MRNVLRVVAVLAAAVASAASATAPGKHTVKEAASVSADVDQTWIAVIDVFAEHNWPIQTVDKASGLIVTDWIRVDRPEADDAADCGSAPLRDNFGADVRFSVRVRAEGRGAKVHVVTTWRGRPQPIDCTSKGWVEDLIHREVRDKVRGR